jgi:hypothetical protein
MMTLADLVSGLGVLLILIPFFMTTLSWMSDKSMIYFLLNLFGGLLAFWGSILVKSVPFAVLEGTWTLVAFFGLVKSLRKS